MLQIFLPGLRLALLRLGLLFLLLPTTKLFSSITLWLLLFMASVILSLLLSWILFNYPFLANLDPSEILYWETAKYGIFVVLSYISHFQVQFSTVFHSLFEIVQFYEILSNLNWTNYKNERNPKSSGILIMFSFFMTLQQFWQKLLVQYARLAELVRLNYDTLETRYVKIIYSNQKFHVGKKDVSSALGKIIMTELSGHARKHVNDVSIFHDVFILNCVSYVLQTCSRTSVIYVHTCLRDSRGYMLRFQRSLCDYVLTSQRALHA